MTELIIKDTHRGLYYEDGVLVRVLTAGRYELPLTKPRLFARRPKTEVVLVDIRNRDLTLKNQCAEALSCSIQWTLSCRGDRGRTVKRELASFDVAEGQTHSVPASADGCGSEATWRIADVRWSCRSATTGEARKREPAKGGAARRTGR